MRRVWCRECSAPVGWATLLCERCAQWFPYWRTRHGPRAARNLLLVAAALWGLWVLFQQAAEVPPIQ